MDNSREYAHVIVMYIHATTITTVNISPRNAARDVHFFSMPMLTLLLHPKLSVLPYGSSRDNSRDI